MSSWAFSSIRFRASGGSWSFLSFLGRSGSLYLSSAVPIDSCWVSALVFGLPCNTVCSLFFHVSLHYDHRTYRSIRSFRFPRSLAHPLLCRASIRTLHGPHWARCKLGSDLKPRSITTVMDLGCWVLPSTVRSLKDRVSERSHPNKAVVVFAYQSF